MLNYPTLISGSIDMFRDKWVLLTELAIDTQSADSSQRSSVTVTGQVARRHPLVVASDSQENSQ